MAGVVLGFGFSALAGGFAQTLGWGFAATLAAKAVGGFVGSMIGGAIDRAVFSRGAAAQASGPTITDFNVTTASYGDHLPLVYGTQWVSGKIIWAAPLQLRSTTTTVSTGGGKGGGGGSSGSSVTQTREYTVGTFAVAFGSGRYRLQRIRAGGKVVWDAAAGLQSGISMEGAVEVYEGSETQLPSATIQGYEGVGRTPGYRGVCYVVFQGWDLWEYGNHVPPDIEAQLQSYSIDDVQEAIDDVCSRSGLPAGSYFSYGMNYGLIGLSINTPSTGRDILDAMASALQFTCCISPDSSGATALRFRHFPVTATGSVSIPWDDLGIQIQDSTRAEGRFSLSSTPTARLPKGVSVKYPDIERDCQSGVQTYSKSSPEGATEIVSISTPIVMTAPMAANVAAVLLQRAWTERETVKFTVAHKYVCLDPGDIVTVQHPNGDIFVRIEKIVHNPDGVLSIEGVVTSPRDFIFSSVYQRITQTPIVVWGQADTEIAILDGPHYDIPDVRNQLWFAPYGSNPGWNGGVLALNSSAEIFAGFMDDAWVGTATTALPEGHYGVLDQVSTVTVARNSTGALSSVTDEIWQGQNLFAIQSSGSVGWEYVMAQTVSLDAGGAWTLSNLVRGVCGTQSEMGLHLIGDRVILLSNLVARNMRASDLLRSGFNYYPVTRGQDFSSVEPIPYVWQGNSLKPFPPVHCKTARQTDGGAILRWIPQSRGGPKVFSTDLDGAPLALNETEEIYDVVIYDQDNYYQTKRTVRVRTENWYLEGQASLFYSAAQQIEDFGTTKAVIAWEVFQISGVVGRGWGSGIQEI